MKRDAGNDDRPSDFCFGTKQLLRRQSEKGRCSSPARAAMQRRNAPNTFATHLAQLPGLGINMFSGDINGTLDPVPFSNQFSHQMEIPEPYESQTSLCRHEQDC